MILQVYQFLVNWKWYSNAPNIISVPKYMLLFLEFVFLLYIILKIDDLASLSIFSELKVV